MQGPGQTRGFEHRASSRAREHFDFQIRVEDELVGGADPLEKIQRLAVTAHQHVLAVVDEVAGVGIGKRIRAAAERGLAFEHRDAKALLRERDPCAQSREAAADHDCIFAARDCHLSRAAREAALSPRASDQVELVRRGKAVPAIEHAIVRPDDPLEQRGIDEPHRLRGEQRRSIFRRRARFAPRVKVRARVGLELHQADEIRRVHAAENFLLAHVESREVFERQINPPAGRVLAHVAQNIGQLKREAEFFRIKFRRRIGDSRKFRCR